VLEDIMEYTAMQVREIVVEEMGAPQYALENYRLRVRHAMETKELSNINTVRRGAGGKGG